jgi:diguanylate cyclase (GGDEF)-like protein
MHVVIVDPSRVIQSKIAADLAADGALVDAFSDSSEALQFVEACKSVEVVLTSLEVEPVSGLELVWSLRSLGEGKRFLHIIVMSSNTSERAFAEALDSGADDFIVKPVGREALRARLRTASRIMALQKKLTEQATTDGLTGLLNRRAFVERMGESRAECGPSEPIALSIFDIDHFKRVNDTYGHDIGDVVLKEIGPIASEEAPIVARLGGEEFALAFPTFNAESGARWCEAVRAAIEAHEFSAPAGTFKVTCSFGVAEWEGDETLSSVMKRADLAVYEAKSMGRNRVIVRGPAVTASSRSTVSEPVPDDAPALQIA